MRQQNPPVLVTHPHQQHPIAQPYTLHIPPHHTASTSHTTTHPTHHTSHTRSHITSYTTPSPSHHFWQDNTSKMRQLKVLHNKQLGGTRYLGVSQLVSGHGGLRARVPQRADTENALLATATHQKHRLTTIHTSEERNLDTAKIRKSCVT